MKRPQKRARKKASHDFTFVEKIAVLHAGLFISKEVFFTATETAFLQKKISARVKNDWKLLFMKEWQSCYRKPVQTYQDCAYLEFKSRHLMDLATHISFDREDHWEGFSVPLDNTFFPFLKPTTRNAP